MSTYEANRYNFSGANVTGIPTSAISSGTFADARLSSSSVTQHVDLSNLSASNLTSGTVPDARVSSGSVTQHVSAVTTASGTWTPSPSNGGWGSSQGFYSRVGGLVHATAKGQWNSITQDSTTGWFISGLPITATNNSTVVGSGSAYLGGQSGTKMYPMVKANESVIRFWSNGSDAGDDSDTHNNENVYAFAQSAGVVLTRKNCRNVSDNQNYWFVSVVYQV